MLKILVVDDEPDVETMFRQQFRKQIKDGNVLLYFALSAAEALSFMDQLKPFDIVMLLSDINMPGLTGLQLLEEVKRLHPDLRVIMITAYGNPHYISESKRLGADGYLTKPVNFTELKEQILQINSQ